MHQLRRSRISIEREAARQLWRRREALRVLSRFDRAAIQEGAEELHDGQEDDPVFDGQAAAGRARPEDSQGADRATQRNFTVNGRPQLRPRLSRCSRF